MAIDHLAANLDSRRLQERIDPFLHLTHGLETAEHIEKRAVFIDKSWCSAWVLRGLGADDSSSPLRARCGGYLRT